VACPGDVITVPVTISDAANLAAMSLALNYNTQALSYVNYSGLNPAIANNFLINNVNGQVRVAWFDLTPANFSAQTILFNLVFNVQGNSPLAWNTATPGDCELGNLDGDIIPTTFTAGSVTMNGVRAVISAASSTNLCTGEQVTLNGPAPAPGVSFQWNLNGAPINGATNSSYTASTAGSFSLTVNSGVGCVSNSNTISVALRTRPSATISATGLSAGNVSVCQGSSVTLNANTGAGFTYQWSLNGNAINGATAASYPANTAGAYSVTVTNSSEGNGCSATSSSVNVIVKPNSSASINAEICQGQTYTFGTQSLSTSGTYTRTLAAANGCDSVITPNLNVKPSAASSITASICQGQAYTFGSQTLTTSGNYTRTLVAANGCDSVISLALTILSNTSSNIAAAICQGQSYTFGNLSLTSSGNYTRTVPAANGCDSTINLDLLVNPTYAQSIQASILFGNSYAFNGQNLTSPGTYTANLLTVNGCDSIITLNLNVLAQSGVSIADATTCQGDTVIVPVSINQGVGISAISLAINYNPADLTFVGSQNINSSIASILIGTNNFGGLNQVRASWSDINPVSLSGTAFELKFLAQNNSSLQFDL
ncbi:MAG: hypothetical protein EBS08_05305, partial [Cytophagia bacterium]|nr:hypothetical protein [Cytophagia bacterium]